MLRWLAIKIFFGESFFVFAFKEIHALLVGNQDFFKGKVFFVFAFKPPRVPIEGAAIICAQSRFVTSIKLFRI